MLVVCHSHLQLMPGVLGSPHQQLTTCICLLLHVCHTTILLGTYVCKFGHLNEKTDSEISNIRHYCNERKKKTAFILWATSILNIWFKSVNYRREFKRKGESTHIGFFRIYIPLLAGLVDTPEEHSRFILPTSERGEILFLTGPCLFSLKQVGFKLKTRQISLVQTFLTMSATSKWLWTNF